VASYRTITTPSEVDERLADTIAYIVDGWYADSRLDIYDLLDRVERSANVDLGEDTDSPVCRRVVAIARKIKKEHKEG